MTDASALTLELKTRPSSLRSETKKPDGVRLVYGYDRTDKLTSIKGFAADDPGNTRPLEETHYWYDARGLLIRASNLAALVEFERDRNGRIICESVNGRRVESKFDARGNRIERRIGQSQTNNGEPGEGLVRYMSRPCKINDYTHTYGSHMTYFSKAKYTLVISMRTATAVSKDFGPDAEAHARAPFGSLHRRGQCWHSRGVQICINHQRPTPS